MKVTEIRPGMIVKGALWYGIVEDVYVSPTTGKYALKVKFVKNAYMDNRPEMVEFDAVANVLSPATSEDLRREYERFKARAEQFAEQLLEQASNTQPINPI